MITFEQIEKANGKLTTVQLGTGAKKRDYVMVPQRVKAFRMLYPEGFITTRILSHENNIVVMQSEAGYYREDGTKVVLGTGMAFEEKGKGLVNGTSYIENCETSSVGRALGFLALGIDGGGICSAEELVNAYATVQRQSGQAAGTAASGTAAPADAGGQAEDGRTAEPETGEGYIRRMIVQMQQEMPPEFDFRKARLELIASGEVDSSPSSDISLENAKKMIRKMYEKYGRMKKVG